MHKIEPLDDDEIETIDLLKVYLKSRRTWGNFDPRTQVKSNDKVYNRKKAKKAWRREID